MRVSAGGVHTRTETPDPPLGTPARGAASRDPRALKSATGRPGVRVPPVATSSTSVTLASEITLSPGCPVEPPVEVAYHRRT